MEWLRANYHYRRLFWLRDSAFPRALPTRFATCRARRIESGRGVASVKARKRLMIAFMFLSEHLSHRTFSSFSSVIQAPLKITKILRSSSRLDRSSAPFVRLAHFRGGVARLSPAPDPG